MSKYGVDPGRLSRVFKALAHPTRLRIFEEVRNRCCVAEGRSADLGGFHVGDLYTLVDISPSTVSHHVAELKQAGLLVERRAGTFLYLTVGSDALRELVAFAAGLGLPPAAAGEGEGEGRRGGERRKRTR